ncbi:hypothetical protein [Halomicrococcus gelatinilyticus]|uniref:hypothetical protein n=1 Tax=Halomicrococcus gelatinilyticus TaxID=1702103 RepID=UPI002E122142
MSIALVLGAAVATVAVPVGVGVFVLSLVAIYLRGYLVPGTPQLTKRYFPDWFLRYFEAHDAAGVHGGQTAGIHGSATAERGAVSEGSATIESKETTGGQVTGTTQEEDGGTDVEPEKVLTAAGVVEPCESVDDLCLTDEFRTAWHEDMARVEDDGVKKRDLAGILDVEESELEFEEHDEAFLARLDGRRIGQWESNSALVADLAAARTLSEQYPCWDSLSVHSQSRVLSGLRIFLEECPDCGGTVVPKQETVESCCRSIDVVAVTCQDCGVRLLEVEQDP